MAVSQQKASLSFSQEICVLNPSGIFDCGSLFRSEGSWLLEGLTPQLVRCPLSSWCLKSRGGPWFICPAGSVDLATFQAEDRFIFATKIACVLLASTKVWAEGEEGAFKGWEIGNGAVEVITGVVRVLFPWRSAEWNPAHLQLPGPTKTCAFGNRYKVNLNAMCVVWQMAGRVFANWWSKVGPYYTKAYQEMWVGMGLIGYFYYKLSYGGESETETSNVKVKLYASLMFSV